METLINRASEETRRANSRAVRKRSEWKSRYAVMTQAIRTTKTERAAMANSREMDMILLSLRVEANRLMERREQIAQELRDTSYKYV